MLFTERGEQELGRVDIAFNGLDRVFGNKCYANRCSQMKDAIDLAAQFFHQVRIAEIGANEVQVGMLGDLGKICGLSGRVVIDHRNLIPTSKQKFGEMRTNETCAASN